MQVINWLEYEEKGTYQRPNLVAFALLEAMANTVDKGDIREHFAPFKPEALEVELTVNGKVVDFVLAMDRIQEAISHLEEEISGGVRKEIAQSLINTLQTQIDEAE